MLAEVRHPRGARSLSSHLKSRLGLEGIKMGLLHELLPKEAMEQPERLAAAIKALPITLTAARPLDEAISSAGGVPFEALDDGLMLRELARRVLRRRNAGLGSAHRRLPADRLLRQRTSRGAGRAGLAGIIRVPCPNRPPSPPTAPGASPWRR